MSNAEPLGASFRAKLQASLAESVYLVHGPAQDAPVWHYVEVDRLKLPLFRQVLASGAAMDVALYGMVIASGWGEQPSADEAAAVAARYGQAE